MPHSELPVFVNDSANKGESNTDRTAFPCHVLITKEEDGTYSGVVLNLPGAGSCGDSEDHVLANVREAVEGLIESYQESKKPIPWKDSSRTEIPLV